MSDLFATFHIEGRLLLAQFINFAVVFTLIYFLIIKGLMKLMRERTYTIEKGLDDAKKAETALIMASHEKERIINEGHLEAKEIVLGAESTKESIVESAKIEAEAEAHRAKQAAIKELEILREHQAREIKEKSVNLVIAGVESILREKISEKESAEIIKGLTKN